VELRSSVLQAVGLTRRFGELLALNNCSVDIQRGTVTGIVGPNGSGKTTLLNCISGILRPDTGRVMFDGTDITGFDPARVARHGIGRTFQTSRVFRRLTVDDHLALAQHLSGRRGPSSASDFLDRFNLAEYGRTLAGQLSFGQQKLVELATVLALQPVVLLLDEPAAGINPRLLDDYGYHIRELAESGCTVVMVEHNIGFVFELCQAVVVMDQGSVIADGPPDVVRKDERVLSAYLGASAE
jgi:ABC-type branched-subunit amino acid transport system ATPase component